MNVVKMVPYFNSLFYHILLHVLTWSLVYQRGSGYASDFCLSDKDADSFVGFTCYPSDMQIYCSEKTKENLKAISTRLGSLRNCATELLNIHNKEDILMYAFSDPCIYMDTSLNESCTRSKMARLDLSDLSLKHFQSFPEAWSFQPEMCGNQCYLKCCACNLKHLNLRGNHLQMVCNESFVAFPNLEKLDLSGNNIFTLEPNAFQKLATLRELNMSRNELRRLSGGFLKFLANLEILDLGQNRLMTLSLDFVPPILKELYLNDNVFFVLKEWTQNLQQLQKLDVTDNPITQVKAADIHSMKKLVYLNLRYTLLSDLPDDLFHENSNLKYVDLSNNQLSVFPKLNSSTLETLILSGNEISGFTMMNKQNLDDLVSLRVFNASSNIMETTEIVTKNCTTVNVTVCTKSVAKIFNSSNSLRILDLSKNLLRSFCFDDYSLQLQELNLSFNEIKQICTKFDSIHLTMALEKLVLSRNLLRNLTNIVLPMNLKYLDLSRNRIKIFSFFQNAENGTYAIPLNLQWVDLSYNRLHILCPLFYFLFHDYSNVRLKLQNNSLICPCEVNTILNQHDEHFTIQNWNNSAQTCKRGFSKLSKGTTFVFSRELQRKKDFLCERQYFNSDCQCNSLSSYSSLCNLPCLDHCSCYINKNFSLYLMNCSVLNWTVVPQLSLHPKLDLILDFSQNHLELLNGSTFASYPLTTELYVNQNTIKDITEDTFLNLTHLEVLNLEDNILETLPPGIFTGLSKLRELYLANTRLKHLPKDIFGPLKALQILHMQNNSMTTFTGWKLEESTSLSKLLLGYNPWHCDCTHVEFIKQWLQNYSSVVRDASHWVCQDGDEIPSMRPILSYHFSHCYTTFPVLPVSVVTAVVTVVMSLLVLLYVWRHEMQVIVYSRYGFRIFHHSQEEEVGKVYDAFLAFCSHDDEFVCEQLVPGLEKIENPYRLCVHQRDFLVGAVITNSILEAVEKSRRTIVVLTQNFVNSGWCIFEFKAAHLQMLTDRCSRLIVIVVGDPPPVMDAEIKLYLKTNTYLKWGDKLFWEKLYFALPDRVPLEETF